MTGERIAEIREKVNGVRWQSPRDVVWNEGAVGQALFEGQSLMTLSDSSARLVFDAPATTLSATEGVPTQTELEIGPKTLIQLKRLDANPLGSEAPLLLLLERGRIQAKSTRALRLRNTGTKNTVGAEIELPAGTRFEAERTSSDGELKLRVTEGSARVRETANAPERTIAVGETLTLTSDSVVKIESAAKPSPTPSPSAEPSPVPSAAPSIAPVLAPPPPAPRLPAPKMRAPILRQRKKPAATSFWHRILPSAFADETAEWEIELQWEPVPSAAAYRIQISRTRGFQKPLVDTTTKDAQWIWLYQHGMENSKGRVFYRIAAIDSTQKAGPFSEARTLEIPKPALPVAIATPRPSPTPTPVVVAKSVERRTDLTPLAERPARWFVAPLAQYGGLSQSSDSQLLRGVSLKAPFLSEGFRLARENAVRDKFTVDFHSAHFQSESGTLAKTRSFRADFALTRPSTKLGGKLEWGYFASLDDRFEKASSTGLKLSRGISFGAIAQLEANRFRLSLALPLTGLLVGKGILGGAYGPKLAIARRFALDANPRPVGEKNSWKPGFIVGEANGEYLLWREPSGTKTTRWAVRIGPEWVIE